MIFTRLLNNILAQFGLRLILKRTLIPAAVLRDYRSHLEQLRRNPGRFSAIYEWPRFEAFETGGHPSSYGDFDCEFAARCIKKYNPKSVLDVGSYRKFLFGLLARGPVTTLDVRSRQSGLENERVVTGDAKALPFPDNSFDAVVSLCALECFGLGRYGDDFDPEADVTAFREMVRVLKVGGVLILSTTITKSQPAIAFNTIRLYTNKMIHSLADGLRLMDEAFYSHKLDRACSFDEVMTATAKQWDVQALCWRKVAKTTPSHVTQRN